LHPQAHAFSFSQVAPHGVGVKQTLGGDGLHGRAAGIPLDDEGDLARQGSSLGADLLHGFEGAHPGSTVPGRKVASISIKSSTYRWYFAKVVMARF